MNIQIIKSTNACKVQQSMTCTKIESKRCVSGEFAALANVTVKSKTNVHTLTNTHTHAKLLKNHPH